MQIINQRLSAIGAFATFIAVLQLNLSAQDWETIILDQGDLPVCEGNGGLVTDSFGNVFAGGNVSASLNGSGPWQGIVLRTDTTAANWDLSDSTISQYPNPAQLNLGVDLAGNLYSVGGLTTSSGAAPSWYVRKSTDHGVNPWIQKDLFQYATGKAAAAVALVADPIGNIFALGYARDKSGVTHWITRKSSNGGDTWSTVDDVKNATPTSLCTVSGVLFACGGNGSWLVRRSTDAGATWTTVDNPFGGWAHGASSDNAGNIYVAGRASKTSGKAKNLIQYDQWTIRRSSNGGTTWNTIDSFTAEQNKSSCARGIGRDAFGNVIAVGYADTSTAEYWTVKKLLASGDWETIDNFENGAWADARSVAVDTVGSLLVNGIVGDTSGSSHWVVRRLGP